MISVEFVVHDDRVTLLFGADKKVFPHFYILGWYSTGSDAMESDMHIHKAVSYHLNAILLSWQAQSCLQGFAFSSILRLLNF